MSLIRSPFEKKPTTYTQQTSLLQDRGMIIEGQLEIEFLLQHINYYRLSAYWLPFEADHTSHVFKSNTRFSEVLNLYVFDRELRLLVLDAIERIEVSVRSQWAYQLAHHHGPHAHLDHSLAVKQDLWKRNLDKLSRETNRSDEVFIKHLKSKYYEALPATWAICEVMSLGLLSRWYNNLRPMPTRRAIAAAYMIDEKVLESWLRHLSLIRNICAHHSRLWNREFTITPLLPRTKPSALTSQCKKNSRKIYNTLVILIYFMDVVSPNHNWREIFKNLVKKHAIKVADLDFPHDWQDFNIWKKINCI